MEFLKKFEFTPIHVLKAAGLLLVALVVLTVIVRLFDAPVRSVFQAVDHATISSHSASFTGKGVMHVRDAIEESVAYGRGDGMALSLNNIGIPAPVPGGTVGGNAEEFEVTEYHASIETRNRERTCREVSQLKAREYVVFERANEYDRGCNYTFKVEHDRVAEVLTIIEALHPRDLSENTYTIKREIDDFTSETEILERKLASIDETLTNALAAYDEVTVLATRTQDVESLAKIIDSRINVIERLTQERISITAQLERLTRAKNEQLDRLEYTYFHVDVYERTLVDGEQLADSWKEAVEMFVRDINDFVQNITINLLALLFVAAQYVLYFFILLFVVKYLYRAAKYIWKK